MNIETEDFMLLDIASLVVWTSSFSTALSEFSLSVHKWSENTWSYLFKYHCLLFNFYGILDVHKL